MSNPPDRGAALAVENLVKRYGDEVAVDDVSLQVRSSEFITFLGPSGSGKTTTLNVIAGFVTPTAGEVLMDGASLGRVPPHRRNIGMIFQNYALFPHMTAAANIGYPLKQRKLPRKEIEQRVGQALHLVGLSGLGGRFPRQLSGGQQQRVAFARAVVFNPRVLLMDEPLGALDRKLREALQVEIKRIHRELGITFIYVTHDQDEALALSDRIIVFNDGRIEQIGTPADLYETPRTLFVAEFIGESNTFSGVVDRGSGTLNADGAAISLPALERPVAGEAVVMIRPHRIALHRADRPPLQNVLAGVVLETVYLGQSVKIVVELEAGKRVLLRERPHIGLQLGVGHRVEIGWNAEDSVLFADRIRIAPRDVKAPGSAVAHAATS